MKKVCTFLGIDFYEDELCPNGIIYLINKETLDKPKGVQTMTCLKRFLEWLWWGDMAIECRDCPYDCKSVRGFGK